MKRILITGANSYIGQSVEKYLRQWPDTYHVDTVDMIGDGWKDRDFSSYDVVFHVAGIAHSDSGKIAPDKAIQYFNVNTALTLETAKKAKQDGVSQFIFMSSIIVFGDSARPGNRKIITSRTSSAPINAYGESKRQAEIELQKIETETFIVSIIRPPMIYGPHSKGNYPILSKLARKLPVIPDFQNERSMIFIGNFVAFIKEVIDRNLRGYFHPQNVNYSSTTRLMILIREAYGKRIRTTRLFNPLIRVFGRSNLIKKAFGSLIYEKPLSEYSFDYAKINLEESIRLTENVNWKTRAS